MLAEGTLPEGYAVRRRRLVKVAAGPDVDAGKGKGTKHKGTKDKGTKHKGAKHKGTKHKGAKHKGKSTSARGKG